MTYPNQPQQGYPYPQQPATQPAPPQGYYPPPQQQVPWPPQQFGQPQYQQPAQPQQPLAQVSLDDYFTQPSVAGGPSISWTNKPLNTTYAGIVARPITNADVQQDTDPQGNPKTFRDGRPKSVMKVPLRVHPTPEFPEGEATWFVRGQARDELVRAMAEAGAPQGAPEAGAGVSVTLVQRRPSKVGNPQNIVQVRYQRPAGVPPVHPVPPEQPAPQPTPIPQPEPTHYVQQPVDLTQYAQNVGGPGQATSVQWTPQQPPAEQAALGGVMVQPTHAQVPPAPWPNQAPPPQQGTPAPSPAGVPPLQPAPQPGVPAAPSAEGLSAEQQQLLAKLTGQQA